MKPFRNGNRPDASGDAGAASSDAELVRAAWRGDKQAFVEIVARHQAMVCGTALGIVGNLAASEDAGQEAFLTAWLKIHDLREPERLRPWLRQIARHVALGYQRRQRGHDELHNASDLPDLSPAPDEQAASDEEAALVRAALTQLPELYREPLILYYRENQSTRAVAEALELSEDTVRQRLARGREMLRDQVSGVIEGVLARTRPTAIFTTTVAVAIGALTAPAVVAGGVFTAAAATGAPGPAAPVSFLKSIAASKILLLLAVMVTIVSIPVGQSLRLWTERAGTGDLAMEQRAVVAASNTTTNPALSAVFAEWKRLHDTHGTNMESMPGIYREITGFNDTLRRQGFRAALMAEWVQLNATNLMACFRDRTIDPGLRQQFIDEWLALDAGSAVDAILASGRGAEAVVRELLPEFARRAPNRVANVVSRLPKPDRSSDIRVREAFAIVAEQGIDFARAAAETMPAANRDQALAGVAQTWGQRDLEAVLAWVKRLPTGTDRDEVIRAALVGAAAIDPASALERVSSVPPGGRKGYFASTTGARVLKEAAAVNFDAAVDWLVSHPGRLSAEDILGMANGVSEKLNADSEAFLTRHAAAGSLRTILPAVTNALVKESSGQLGVVWEWLKRQPDEGAVQELRRHVLTAVGRMDTTMALRLAAEAPENTTGNDQLRRLANGLVDQGYAVHRLDRLLQQGPVRLRSMLLDVAFEHLNSGTFDDPQRWIRWLSQLPDGARVRGSESIARAWAGQSVEGAIRWAESLPSGETRSRAMAGIAQTWAAQDSPSAAAWVASMPAGSERDDSAEALVSGMADEYPREAWEWAMSIDDQTARTRAATRAARTIAARDSALARSWVENGPLTRQAKAVIQSALGSGNENGQNGISP